MPIKYQPYGQGANMEHHGEGKDYQEHLTSKTGYSQKEHERMDPETRTVIEYSHRHDPKWKA